MQMSQKSVIRKEIHLNNVLFTLEYLPNSNKVADLMIISKPGKPEMK